MYKINLHCHSLYSDGREPIAVLMEEHKKNGFSALVVTDHVYPYSYGRRSLTSTTWRSQMDEMDKLSEYFKYPIIQGIELCLRKEEILVFGYEVIFGIFRLIDQWLYNERQKDKDIHCMDEVEPIEEILLDYIAKNKHRCAVILCHPSLRESKTFDEETNTMHIGLDSFYDKLFPILDGYERYNSGIDMFDRRDIPHQLGKLKGFKNSDLHFLKIGDMDCVLNGENYSPTEIVDENQLIKWIKQ